MAAAISHPPEPPAPAPAPPSVRPETLSRIDLSTLSQSELRALSVLSSSSAAESSLVSPAAIDPSIFNESTGSRRQTYSSSAAAASHHRRRTGAAAHSDNPSPQPPPPSTADLTHNRLIIDRLKSLISRHPSFHAVRLLAPSLLPPPRKRGRKPKSLSAALAPASMPAFSVDAAALAAAEDPFGEELRRRTAGVESEEGVLGFMRAVEGQWGSRRKRRRIVDAAEFGEVLPLGWKLLLGIRRKEGRAWIYCRRYISPTGQHFISCKDVSLYLQSIGSQSMTQHPDYGHTVEDIQTDRRNRTENHAGLIFKDGAQRQDINAGSIIPTSVSNGHGNEVMLLGIENLADVQIQDLFECHKCNMTFDEKDSYLQHLLSIHQRITRRYRLGSSVGEGVIIKDGKYECQFCHKVFLERRRYNGHVGIHVRNYVRRAEEVPGSTVHDKPESPPRDNSSSRISKMDALIEIAHNSILENSSGPSNAPKLGAGPHKSHEIVNPESAVLSSCHGHDADSPLCEQELDDPMIDQDHSDHQDNEDMVIDGSTKKDDDASGLVDVKMVSILDDTILRPSELEGVSCVRPTLFDAEDRTKGNNGSEFVELANDSKSKMDIDGSTQSPTNTIETQLPLPCFPTACEISNKVEQLFGVDPSHENVTGFDELRMEAIEPLKYGFADGEESVNLQDVPIELANSSDMESMFGGSSIQFESEEAMLNMSRTDQTSTVCVWCGIKFNHNAVDSEQESVGFMCQSCKSKVTAHHNELDNGSPVNPHSL